MEIVYFTFSGGDLRAGIGWDLVFIAINAYQLYWLVQERWSLRLPDADRDFLRSVLVGLEDAQIARLLSAGEFSDLPARLGADDGEYDPREDLFHLHWRHQRDHRRPRGFTPGKRQLCRRSRIPHGSACNGYRSGPERCPCVLVFEKDRLNLFFRNETEVAGLIYQLLGRELAHKMKLSNSLISAGTATA